MSATSCDKDVFERGTSLGMFEMTKAEAEAYCKAETERTGSKHDWHYVAGRVHVKALLSSGSALEEEAIKRDAERYRELKRRYCGADFDWNEKTVLVFRIPPDARVSTDLDTTVDAMKEQQP